MPKTQGNDPMCLDKPWMTWVEAYLAHTVPQISTVGVGYMTALAGVVYSRACAADRFQPLSLWGFFSTWPSVVYGVAGMHRATVQNLGIEREPPAGPRGIVDRL